MNYLLEAFLNTLFKALLLSSLLIVCDKKKRKYIWLFILISSLNDLGLRSGKLWPNPFHLYWNWEGKIASILISVAFVVLLKRYVKTLPFTEYKISFKQRIFGKRAILYAVFFILLNIAGNFVEGRSKLVMETVLFQLTMPGIDEELSFRGIYLALLNKVFEKKYRLLDCKFGWGLIIVSILFGAVHGLNISINTGIRFDIFNFFVTGGLGFCFGILAEASGSLVLPIAAHNMFNTLGYLIRVFK
jgi:uncharacterized protein